MLLLYFIEKKIVCLFYVSRYGHLKFCVFDEIFPMFYIVAKLRSYIVFSHSLITLQLIGGVIAFVIFKNNNNLIII